MRFAKFLALPLLLVLLAACESSEEKAEAFFQSGMELREDGDLDRAALEFRNVFRYDGAHKEARTNLAEVLLLQGNPNAAYSQYLRLAEQYPDDVDTRLALTGIAVDQQIWSEVRRHGPVAVENAPDRPESRAIATVLDYLDATDAEDEASTDAALAKAEALLADNPDLDVARRLVVLGLLAANRLEEGLEALDAALERKPDDPALHTLRLQVLNTLDRPEEVEAQLRDMYARFPENEEIWRGLIAFYVQREDLAAAEEVLRTEAGPRDGPVEGHLTVVQFLVETQGAEAARAELAQLIAANEGNAEAMDRYVSVDARLAFGMGARDEATDLLRARLEDDADTGRTMEIQTLLAQMLTSMGNQVGARALVEEVLAEDASNVDALKLRSVWLIEADKPVEAITELRTALDQAPNDAEILTLMAQAHERAGDTELAGERLALAVDLSGNAVVETLRYARFLLQQNRVPAARALLDESVGANPGSVDLLTEQARLALQEGDTAVARTAISKLDRIENDPVAADRATALRAALLLDEQRVEEGVALLESRAEGNNASGSAVLDVVRTRLRAGQLDEARAYLTQRLNERPEDPVLRFAAAVLQLTGGDVESAEIGLRSLIAEFPEAPAPVQQLYSLLRNDDRRDEAEEVLEAALKRMPEARSLLLIRAGNLEAEAQLEEALAVYETLYAANSDDLVVANNLASLLSDLRDDEESLARAAAIALRLNGTRIPAFRDTYGWIAYRQGKYEEALTYLESAAESMGDNPVVLYHLGMTYAALDRTEEARQTLEQAVALADDGDLPQIARARQTLQGL